MKILDLANLFVADAPMKKNQESEHFEIWVLKPAIAERVNNVIYLALEARVADPGWFYPNPTFEKKLDPDLTFEE